MNSDETVVTHTWGEDLPPLTLDTLRGYMNTLAALPPVPPPIEFSVRTADEQMRTIRDVPIMWTRPKVPSKRAGRRGTRRAWKRRHPPHMLYGYREPTNMIVLAGSARSVGWMLPRVTLPDLFIVTPRQKRMIDEGYEKMMRKKMEGART